MTPLPKSAVLIDRVAQTVDTLRHFENHGHKRILFVGHYRKPRPYKQYELETAAKIVGLKLWTPWNSNMSVSMSSIRIRRT